MIIVPFFAFGAVPGLRTPTQTEHVAMNTTANLTSVVLEEPQEGPENEMTFVFLGVVATTMILFLVGTLWARRKDHKEKEMVRILRKES